MRTLSRPLLALLALTPFLQARLEQNLPASTFGIAKVESAGKTRKNLETNPLVTAMKAQKLADFFKPLVDKIEAENPGVSKGEFKKVCRETLEAFTGEVVLALVKTPEPIPGHLPYDFILLADTSADEARVTELLKKLDILQPVSADKAQDAAAKSDEDAEDDEDPAAPDAHPRIVTPEIFSGEEVHNGTTLHTLSMKTDEQPLVVSCWAVVGKTFVYATAPNVMRELVDAVKEGRKDNVTDRAFYKANRETLEDSDAWALLNMPLITGLLREKVVEKSKGPDGETTPGIMGMHVLKAYDSLGLDAFEHFRISVTLKPDDTRADTSLAWSENRGVVRFITECNPKDATPDLSVIPSGVMAANATRFDFSKFLTLLESMLKEALPLCAPMLDMQIDRLKKEESIDLRGALMENFGDELWSFSDPMPADSGDKTQNMAPTVLVIALKDENKFNSLVETIAGKAAPQTGDGVKSLFEERDLLGVKVRSVKNLPPTVPRIQYAITKGRLYISLGEGKLIDRTLAQFNDPKGGLASEPAFREGLAKLPKGGSSISYYNLGEYLESIVKGTSGHRLPNSNVTLDPAAEPVAADLPFVALGTGILHEKEAVSRTVIIRKPDAKN